MVLVSAARGTEYLAINDERVSSIDLSYGESCTIEVVSSGDKAYIESLYPIDFSLKDLELIEIRPAAGLGASVTPIGKTAHKLQAAGTGIRSGVHFVFQYSAMTLGKKKVELRYFSSSEVLDSIIIDVMPPPAGTAFTYQGRLVDLNEPADGFYEFEFKLYDLPIGGDQVGGTIALRGVEVIDGYFTVILNFGDNAFDGDARWLETGVRPVDTTDPFATLSPRQEMTPAPYAIFAQNTAGGIVGGGVANYIPKFTAGDTIEISSMFESSGNVGIKTTNPRTDLEILGTTGLRVTTGQHSNVFGEFKHAYSGGLIINANAGGGWADMSLQTDTVTRMFIEKSGNVGVGTVSPSQKLHVAGTIYSSTGGFRFPDNTTQTTAATAGTQYWSSIGDSIRNTNTANVGIGIGSGIPSAKLTVGGNILVSSENGMITTPILEITGGSDLSEQFDVRSDEKGILPLPGMVVIIAPDNSGELLVSSQSYDRKVAGIISGAGGIRPGMIMGQKGSIADGANPIALTGRVYCLADASYGSIQPGDLLTTSDTPGHAMKVTDYPKAQGAIIGKAMTSLQNGQGQVLVLVTLQ